jgi:hypothetical protein
MNERLQELYLQAAEIAQKQEPTDLIAGQIVRMEKFAELIVKECIDQVLTGPNGPAYYAVEAAMRVKKHFGVEE